MRKFLTLMAFSLALGFTACSDDDDNDYSNATVNAIIETNNGEKVLVSSPGGFNIQYNEKGQPIQVGDYIIDYKNGTICDKDEYDEDEGGIIKFTMNGQGYITSLTVNVKESWEGNSYSIYEKMTYSYDAAGHLCSIKGSWSESYTEDGTTYKDSGTGTGTLTWDNGRITDFESETKCSVNEDGEKTEYTETSIGEVESAIKNPLGQYSHSYCDNFGYEELGFAGLFGKAPSYFPTKITFHEKNYDEDYGKYYEENSILTYSFAMNSNGTIYSETETEIENGHSYSHTYRYYYGSTDDYVDSYSTKAKARRSAGIPSHLRSFRNIFVRAQK